jgi:hypothetical protein
MWVTGFQVQPKLDLLEIYMRLNTTKNANG